MDIQSDKIFYVFHVASPSSGYATRCNQELSCHLFFFLIFFIRAPQPLTKEMVLQKINTIDGFCFHAMR